MASPQSPDSLAKWASEACREADLDSTEDRGRSGTLPSLPEGDDAPETNEEEPNCVDPTDLQPEAVEDPSGSDDGHTVSPSATDRSPPAESVTGVESEDAIVKSVDAEDQVPPEERPPAPPLEGPPGQTEEGGGELKEGTQKEAEPHIVQAEKTPEDVNTEHLSINGSEPGVQAEGSACEEDDGDLAEGGHTLVHAPNTLEGSGVAEEPSAETESESLDSPVFLSDIGEDAEDLSVDSQPVDFSSAREQWVRRDSSSCKPPTPCGSRKSSVSWASDLPPFQVTQTSEQSQAEEAFSAPGAIPACVQQGEEGVHNPSVLKEKQEGQQVFEETPPIDTVARKSTNLVAESSAASPIVLKEPLTEPGAEREGVGEGEAEREREVEAERESGQTSRDRNQRAASIHTGQTEEEESQAEGEANQWSETAQLKTEANAAAQLKTGKMEADPYDDNQSDSGVSADFSPISTGEISTPTPISDSPEPGKPPPNETPIEREIRLAAEREQSLRQARGMSSTDRGQEFVDLPVRRPILSQALPSQSGKDKSKERQFAGKKMQREISQESQREQDLVQLGRVSGVYEKGTVRQLRERKHLFEAFQQPVEPPATSPPQSQRRTSSVSASDLYTLGVQGDESSVSSICGSSRRHSLDLLSQFQSPTPQAAQGGNLTHQPPPACGPGLSEGTSYQVIILESPHVPQTAPSVPDRPLHPSPGSESLTEEQPVTVVDSGTALASSSPPLAKTVAFEQEEEEEEEEEVNSVMVRENPFFKLRSSMSLRPEVELDIRQAQERERDLRKQRSSLYQGPAGGGEGSTPSPTPAQNGLLVPQHQTRSTSSSVAQHSFGTSSLTRPRPQTDPAQREQTEARKSPPCAVRTPRQKTPLVQRWESGMVNGHRDEEEE